MKKVLWIGGLLILVLLVVFVYKTTRPPLGAASGPDHFFQQNFLAGLLSATTTQGTTMVPSGAFQLGAGGTPLVKFGCASTSATFGTVAQNGTTSVNIAFPAGHLSTTTAQTYFVGVATSNIPYWTLSATLASTTNNLAVLVQNRGASQLLATTTVSACYLQF